MFEWLFKQKLVCPHCGFTFYYSDYGKDRNDGLCPNCKRGMYIKPAKFFHQFPIAPDANNWIIMPLCEVCGVRPSVMYDGNDHKKKCSECLCEELGISLNANQQTKELK